MKLPDFKEPRDPDASSKKLWAAVPEPVRLATGRVAAGVSSRYLREEVRMADEAAR